MKKYCLTACFKRNISAKAEAVLDFFLAVLIVIGVFIASTIIIGIIGGIAQLGALYFDVWWFHYNTLELGFGVVFLPMLLALMGKVAYDVGKWIYLGLFSFTKNIALNVVAPEQAKCRIFEECTTDKES